MKRWPNSMGDMSVFFGFPLPPQILIALAACGPPNFGCVGWFPLAFPARRAIPLGFVLCAVKMKDISRWFPLVVPLQNRMFHQKGDQGGRRVELRQLGLGARRPGDAGKAELTGVLWGWSMLEPVVWFFQETSAKLFLGSTPSGRHKQVASCKKT